MPSYKAPTSVIQFDSAQRARVRSPTQLVIGSSMYEKAVLLLAVRAATPLDRLIFNLLLPPSRWQG